MRTIIATDKAPAAIGPYAQANAAGDFIFTSGQIPLDPATGKLVEGEIEEPCSWKRWAWILLKRASPLFQTAIRCV